MLASVVYSEAVAGMVGLVPVVVESWEHFGAVAGREPVVLAAGPEEVVVGCMAEPDTECVVQEVLLHRESFEPLLCHG